MICDECSKKIQAYPCACGYQPPGLTVQAKWLIQHCATPGCCTAIRVKAGQQLATPICKWCDQGTRDAKDWPAGMPNPDNPWPWCTEDERERKCRMPYWKARIAEAVKKDPRYQKWIVK